MLGEAARVRANVQWPSFAIVGRCRTAYGACAGCDVSIREGCA